MLIACQPFTSEFPRADIHDIIAPDILHQVVKGTFKDHLVSWVEDYLLLTYSKDNANAILDDIDRRIALMPPFPGLRRFPQGRGFKQWTGDDSKALMKMSTLVHSLYLADVVFLGLPPLTGGARTTRCHSHIPSVSRLLLPCPSRHV
ncbi:hypothetical protein EDB84DRAFT_1403566 [Lactarius hengduanensis]|nr:hypothetical protein EDB84DRAFT_1403566 [Lactarius hengduanensis]